MPEELGDSVAIVTGGASGIGGAISRVLARRGARVVAVDLDESAGAALAEELGDSVAFLAGDVSDPAVAARWVELAVSTFGFLTSLVNNAHASRQGTFVSLSEDDWALSMDTGLRATRQFMLAAYPELRKQGGSVVNFGSGAGLEGQQTQAAYAAAKEAIRGLSRVVANEWAAADPRQRRLPDRPHDRGGALAGGLPADVRRRRGQDPARPLRGPRWWSPADDRGPGGSPH